MMNSRSQKAWSDKFIPEVQSILGRIFIQVASKEEDCRHNTDLTVLASQKGLFLPAGIRWGVRIRRYKYIFHSDEFTIRWQTNFRSTEIDKIVAGWGDYLFYGFASEDETSIEFWRIVDMEKFRAFLKEFPGAGTIIKNKDGTLGKSFNTLNPRIKELVMCEGGKRPPKEELNKLELMVGNYLIN